MSMRTSSKLLLVFLVLVLCVVGFGFYSGWWALSSSSPNADTNKVDVNLTVNPDKMKEDAATVKDKAADLTGQAKDKANELGDQKEGEEKEAETVQEKDTEPTGQAKEEVNNLDDPTAGKAKSNDE